jgi:hypothetical protein
MKALAPLALVLTTLTSCAKHYVAPTGVPTATLTLAADVDDYGPVVMVQNFADERCGNSPNGNRLATFTTTGVQGKGDSHSGVDRSIPAGQPMVFSYIFTAGAAGFTDTQKCAVTQSFLPEAGAHYRAQFLIQGNRCVVQVRREDGTDPLDVPGLHELEPACNNIING